MGALIGILGPDPFYPLHVWRFYPRAPERKVSKRTPSAPSARVPSSCWLACVLSVRPFVERHR
eukprot:1805154-Prymnesium_polylepis.1